MKAWRPATAASIMAIVLGASGAAAEAVEAAGPARAPARPCIPFDAANNQITVTAKVNGRAGVSLALDTAAVGLVLDERQAAALGLQTDGRQMSHGAG
jgi:hypothetical protein